MRKLHEAGFKTFASIEPMIDFENSKQMIINTMKFCDLYEIGLISGSKLPAFHVRQGTLTIASQLAFHSKAKIYFKDRLLKVAGIRREDLPENCVTRDYNMFFY